MDTKKDNQNSEEVELNKYQQVHHQKNAFVVGDKVLMKKNGKNVWRTITQIDSAVGKLYFADGNSKGITVHDFKEQKKDLVITTDAWEKAFALINEVWNETEAAENRKKCVVSCETVDGIACVVITNDYYKVQKKWCVRRDYWSLLKTVSTNTQKQKIWAIKVGESKPVTINPNKAIGHWKKVDERAFYKTPQGTFKAWKIEFHRIIGEKCEWLLDTPSIWKCPDSEKLLNLTINQIIAKTEKAKRRKNLI